VLDSFFVISSYDKELFIANYRLWLGMSQYNFRHRILLLQIITNYCEVIFVGDYKKIDLILNIVLRKNIV